MDAQDSLPHTETRDVAGTFQNSISPRDHTQHGAKTLRHQQEQQPYQHPHHRHSRPPKQAATRTSTTIDHCSALASVAAPCKHSTGVAFRDVDLSESGKRLLSSYNPQLPFWNNRHFVAANGITAIPTIDSTMDLPNVTQSHLPRVILSRPLSLGEDANRDRDSASAANMYTATPDAGSRFFATLPGAPIHATASRQPSADTVTTRLPRGHSFSISHHTANLASPHIFNQPIVPVSPADPSRAFHAEHRSVSVPDLSDQANREKRFRPSRDDTFSPQKRQRSRAPTDDSSRQPIVTSPVFLVRNDAPNPQLQLKSTNGVSAGAIDLTEDKEDDEIEEVQKPSQQEICYGMVDGVVVHAFKIASPPMGIQSLDPRRNPAMKVNLRRIDDFSNKDVKVFDSTRTEIGLVEQKFASQMVAFLASRAPLRFQARIPSEPKQPNQEPGQKIKRDYKLQVTICGPRQWSKTFGRSLLSTGFELTQPSIMERGLTYENPQLSLPPQHQAQAIPRPGVHHQPRPLALSQQQYRMNGHFLAAPQDAPQGQVNGYLHNPVANNAWMMMSSDRSNVDIQNDVMNVFDSLNKQADLPLAEPSGLVRTPLLKHQKQGLYFMLKREKPINYQTGNSEWTVKFGTNSQGRPFYRNVITGESFAERPADMFGGLLADEMGLGKTLSILSLCASSLPEADEWARKPVIQHTFHPEDPLNGGPSWRRGGLLQIERHAKTTVLVCPLSTISNWVEQIQTHIDPAFTWYTYHGQNRTKNIDELAQYDLILTTYSTASTDLTQYLRSGAVKPPLERVGWFRVALDEAHQIRQSSTTNFKAMVRLRAERRWSITGTPIQNRLEDLGSLFSFMRLSPFYDPAVFNRHILQPFKNADPNVVPKLRVLVDSVTIRRKKSLITLPKKHDNVVKLEFSPQERRDYQVFAGDAQNRAVALTRHSSGLKGRAYMTILQAISRLRKMCAFGTGGLNDDDLKLLIGRSAEEPIDLDSEDERDSSAASVSRALQNLQLLRDGGSDTCRGCDRRVGLIGNGDDGDSTICYLTNCVALYCAPCYDESVKAAAVASGESRTTCPNCANNCPATGLKKSDLEDVAEPDSGAGAQNSKGNKKKVPPPGSIPHTKTLRLVQDLLASKQWSIEHPDEAPEKSIVFSAWTTHLDLIEHSLKKANISFTRLDGTMSLKQRTAAINTFREDESIHLILVSIYAGGLGLNLTSGSMVYVMEPQWNPQVEAQAVDRVHRLGQDREVHIVRYIMKNSFEDKVRAVQRKKEALADLSMDNKKLSKEEATRQRLQDIRDLFR
ncbi:hypothetical protein MKZ38_002035 [Zalerion maritima]|uniref:Uncharacterized protein n=1 Tax=Zalerion maritima TaxID=339359 RepID=A0AAD5WVF2_9PEZI|nr:hypothetical protein MKZ38_002035 [Zalerion maritima]